jgi:hypothetical protein
MREEVQAGRRECGGSIAIVLEPLRVLLLSGIGTKSRLRKRIIERTEPIECHAPIMELTPLTDFP